MSNTAILTRRDFISLIAGAAVGARSTHAAAVKESLSTRTKGIRAVAFDVFAVFNPSNVLEELERTFPAKGSILFTEWRTRLFEYSWLRALSGDYADFWRLTGDALVWSSKKLNLTVSSAQRERFLSEYLRMAVWPETPVVLRDLKSRGLRLALLSNFTPSMLIKNLEHASLRPLFESAISTDEAHTYKPDPRAYALGLRKLRLTKEQVLFVAFAGWDAAGAKHFGYPTYWVNRLMLPVEELGATPDGVAPCLEHVPGLIQRLERGS